MRELGERAQRIIQTVLDEPDMGLRLALEHSLLHRVGMALGDPAIALPLDNINHGRIVCSGAPPPEDLQHHMRLAAEPTPDPL